MNYFNALPDFLTIQRISFCWFIASGLTQELSLFSSLKDFTKTTEYIIFGNEYRLIKPLYSLSIARKYSGNYRVQILVPIEIRRKKDNIIQYQNQFPIITLPLMTTYSTFIINGCERVIVSQIIRSPGIYFEQSKNQKFLQPFKRKSSTHITNLRKFLPSGEAFFSEQDILFAIPKLEKNSNKTPRIIPTWDNNSIYYYSIINLKKSNQSFIIIFLKYFKSYCLISNLLKSDKKQRLIHIFFKWIKLKNYSLITTAGQQNKQIKYIFHYFKFLSILLIKSKILSNFENLNSTINLKSLIINNNYEKIYKLSILQCNQLFNIYNKIIFNSQLSVHLQLNIKLYLVNKHTINWLFIKYDFQFLNKTLNLLFLKTNNLISLINFSNLRPTIYFSTTLKDQLKYILLDSNKSLYNQKYHKYLKTKAQFLLYKQDNEIKTNYNKKYSEKEFYAATLIPEYGSWIRFGFQKNIKLNQYKYPIKNRENELKIQLDKIYQKSIIELLKEMGLTDLEIYKNLSYSDFFYFDKPLLVNSIFTNQPLSRFVVNRNSFSSISKFSKIFDANYYRLGKIGRSKINKRLNLEIHNRLQTITYDDIFAISDQLINLIVSKKIPDDIDHLKNRRVRSIGELLQHLFQIGLQRLFRKIQTQIYKLDSVYFLNFSIINTTLREFFGSSQLSQYLDQTNPLSSLTHRRRISSLGPGGLDRDRISFTVRDIHPSHYGRICPIETPEGQNVGLIASLTTCSRINKLGFLETPFWRVINGKIIKTGNPIYLTADIEDYYKVAPADLCTNNNNYILKNVIPVRYRQDFINVIPSDIDFISISTIQIVSIAASLIPFFEHDDANRSLMGSNMQRQSVPLIFPQKPIVGTGLENQIAINSGMVLSSHDNGIISSVMADKIIIKNNKGQKRLYQLQKYLRSNQQTCINHRPIIWKGETVKSGQILTDGPAIVDTELSLGQNVLIAYMPWHGYNFEDAILISERLIYDDTLTSIHIERYRIELNKNSEISEKTTKIIPNLSISDTKHLNQDGIVMVGTFVKRDDILVGKVISNIISEQLPESKLLKAIFGSKSKNVKDNSYRMPNSESGRVIETVTFNRRMKNTYKCEKIFIFIAQNRKIKVGDKIAGRHGNKGIISRILPRQDMPFLPDGTPIDIILNPLGVPSRMNVGQLYECLLGLAGDKLNLRFKILPFDEMYGLETSRILINQKLRQASIQKNESWLFNPYCPGKMVLIDGRTGQAFENPITVGNAYMLKLIHLVDDKMHARATGPYSLITQQPLRGKSQQGGQRFGEMEVWALEGFGAAFTLKELLTIKSDDMSGRNETLNAIVKGKPIPQLGIPESFKVLLQELRSIGLDMTTYQIEKFSSSKLYETEINLIENYNSILKTFSTTSKLDNISF